MKSIKLTLSIGSVKSLVSFLGLILYTTASLGAVPSTSKIKSKALADVNKLIEKNHSLLTQTKSKIKIKIQERVNSHNTQIERDLERISYRNKELLRKKDFLNRLYFQLDTYYISGSLRSFLIERIKILATRELTSPSSQQSIWKFFHYLSVVLENSDRNEDSIDFLATYMNYAGIGTPKKPKEFLALQKYTTDNHRQVLHSPVFSPQIKEKKVRFAKGLSLITNFSQSD